MLGQELWVFFKDTEVSEGPAGPLAPWENTPLCLYRGTLGVRRDEYMCVCSVWEFFCENGYLRVSKGVSVCPCVRMSWCDDVYLLCVLGHRDLHVSR